MTKSQEIYEWVKENSATQQQAADHFQVSQGYISRAVRSHAEKHELKTNDKRRKIWSY